MRKLLTRLLIGFVAFAGLAFWALFFSPRPALTTDPAILAGDGSLVNYCVLPVLDGSDLMAADIPKGNTPGCGYKHFPLPILARCTEPLADGAQTSPQKYSEPSHSPANPSAPLRRVKSRRSGAV